MSLGNNIAHYRKRQGLTQEQLAEIVGVSFQSVSSWERDETLPDTGRLKALSRALSCSLDALFCEDRPDWTLKAPHSDPEHMYTYVKARAQSAGLTQTLEALPLMRQKHARQFRKGMTDAAPYVTHPLTLACHALAMGIGEDDVLAALLLHDVIEDTDTTPEELPVNERVRKAVCLVSYNSYPGDKESIKPLYYRNIAQNPLAALVKCIDRCNNLSCMADGFGREKMIAYVLQTEKYILPLLEVVKNEPKWNSAAWLLKYQMTALLESFKRLL